MMCKYFTPRSCFLNTDFESQIHFFLSMLQYYIYAKGRTRNVSKLTKRESNEIIDGGGTGEIFADCIVLEG